MSNKSLAVGLVRFWSYWVVSADCVGGDHISHTKSLICDRRILIYTMCKHSDVTFKTPVQPWIRGF